MVDDVLPTLEPGLTHLDSPGPRSTALHRVVVEECLERDGLVYWLDARNVAASYALYELAPHRRALDGIRVARAFTAYQHHTLARRLVRAVDGRTALVVAPNLASLYRDDDVPDYESEDLYAATATLLAGLGDTHDVPVLVTTDASGAALPPAIGDDAAEWSCERTQMGLRYAGAGGETQVYVKDGFWQTTIPYWVELFGRTRDLASPAASPSPAPALADWS
ncbi:MAG: hypothetical protein ABEH64_00275 [Salinirussus sp.]